jgi:hypothetical protein
MFKKTLYLPFLVIVIISCINTKNNVSSEQIETVVQSGEARGIRPIDIKAPKFFWLIQPWKEGKLATIDGWGRFAEISFVGANKIKITPLVNFPRTQLDRDLITWPEAGLIASTTGKIHHLAAIDDKKTKTHTPLLSWVHLQLSPVLLDSREGLVGYTYASRRDENDVNRSLFVYNYKEDRIIYESPKDFTIWMRAGINERYMLSKQAGFDGKKTYEKDIFYDWRMGEIVENDLTKALYQNNLYAPFGPCRNIHQTKRYLFGYSRITGQTIKITWDEKYSDIKTIPLSYLVPKERYLHHFILSGNGTWGTSLVGGYRGLRNEQLKKRAFFHMDERYPNGISMPVITEDYEDFQWELNAFVEHPVHGMCFAQEWHKKNGGRDQLYLRLYKMSDVLAEINRRLLKAEDVLKE